ncbi:MAG TPA: AI-2E family transporter [Pilimelia sp.]|nr:AI-2E family transporter [Pilimelia sp.]
MHELRRATAHVTVTVIGLVVATWVAWEIVRAAQRVLVWMVIAAFLATALKPAVDWCEQRVRWCRRWLATLLVFLVVTMLMVAVGTAFVVPLAREGAQLVAQIPELVRDTQQGRGPLAGLLARFELRERLARHSDDIAAYVTGLGAPTLALLGRTATAVAGAVTIFVLSYVMVLEAPRVAAGLRGLFPPERGAWLGGVAHRCGRTVTGYLTGNLVISVVCGALTYGALRVLSVPYAALIALFVALADLVPLVGATLGAVVAVLAGLSQSVLAAVVLAVFFIVYQQVEDHLLQPLIYARTVQLSPLTVLVAILIGVELAGILGALLAIPAAGIVKVVLGEARRRLSPAPPDGPADAAASPPAGAAPAGPPTVTPPATQGAAAAPSGPVATAEPPAGPA